MPDLREKIRSKIFVRFYGNADFDPNGKIYMQDHLDSIALFRAKFLQN